ncbi:hypothetical protein KR018_012440 [Drosophila ironensis]|nr:hypothetical protein KR018_012440 [Drosophila ironensis]
MAARNLAPLPLLGRNHSARGQRDPRNLRDHLQEQMVEHRDHMNVGGRKNEPEWQVTERELGEGLNELQKIFECMSSPPTNVDPSLLVAVPMLKASLYQESDDDDDEEVTRNAPIPGAAAYAAAAAVATAAARGSSAPSSSTARRPYPAPLAPWIGAYDEMPVGMSIKSISDSRPLNNAAYLASEKRNTGTGVQQEQNQRAVADNAAFPASEKRNTGTGVQQERREAGERAVADVEAEAAAKLKIKLKQLKKEERMLLKMEKIESQIAKPEQDVEGQDQPAMDTETRLRASQFFNLMLARMWRRRKAEVLDLHALVHRFRAHAVRCHSNLLMRNEVASIEQRRGQNSTNQLLGTIQNMNISLENFGPMDMEVKNLRKRETSLRKKLLAKTKECEYFAEVLENSRIDLFRELARYREGCAELANQQRRAMQLEFENSQLEDELLTLKDLFQQQNDKMAVALGQKQEQLDTAYETLKHCEQELANLELKHREILRLNQIDTDLQNEITEMKRNMGLGRYLLYYLSGRNWGSFHVCMYHIVAGTMDCFLPPSFAPPMEDNMVRLALAGVFLLISMY